MNGGGNIYQKRVKMKAEIKEWKRKLIPETLDLPQCNILPALVLEV
jgi:hypothetical protein